METRGYVLTIVLALIPVALAFIGASRFGYRIPTRSRFYRFHTILYLGTVIWGLLASALMKLSSYIDWWLDDATIFLELVFGIVGAIVCVMVAPGVWWLERQPDSVKASKIGRLVLTTITTLPYFLILGVILFYHE